MTRRSSVVWFLLALACAAVLLPRVAAASTLRIKIVTTYSDDPNDPLAQAVSLIQVKIDDVVGITGDGEDSPKCVGGGNFRQPCGPSAPCPGGSCHGNPGSNGFDGDFDDDGFGLARIEIQSGFHAISIPTSELVDFDGNTYRVGSVFVSETNDGITQRCEPIGTEGNVGYIFEDLPRNDGSGSEYEVGIRIVPLNAPKFTGGEVCLSGTTGRKQTLKCERAINAGSQGYLGARLKALGKCHAAKLARKLPTNTDCSAEEKTRAAIQKAQGKLEKAIHTACGGRDTLCGTNDDLPLGATGFGGTCPDLLGFGCTNTLASCGDVAACLLCIDSVAADKMFGVFGKLGFAGPKEEKALNKCQKSFADAGADLATELTDVYEQCAALELAGRPQDDCLRGKDGFRLSNLKAKLQKTIGKACVDPDAPGQTFAAGRIGFPAECPRVPGLNGSRCGDSSLGTLVDARLCVECLAEYFAECTSIAAAPNADSLPYPVDCASSLP